MRKYVMGVVVGMLMVGMGAAQTAAPVVPDAVKVKILKISVEEANLRDEYSKLMARKAEIEKAYPQTAQDMQAAIKEAYAATKADEKLWNIDTTKAEFVAAPQAAPTVTPAPVAPAAGVKK